MPILYRFTSGCTLWDQVFHFLICNFDVLVLALFCVNFYDISYLNILGFWVIFGFWSPLKSSWKSVFKGQFARQLLIARDFIWKSIDDAIYEMTREKTRGICLMKCLGHKEFSFSDPQLYLTIIMSTLICIITYWWINGYRVNQCINLCLLWINCPLIWFLCTIICLHIHT